MENCFDVSTFEEGIDFSKYPESQDLDCLYADSPCNLFLVCYVSDNKVREPIAVKVLHTSLLNTPVVAFKYSLWEAMHRCQRPVQPSKQFWTWFCEMTFRAAVVLLWMSSMSSKYPPFNISFNFGNRKKSLGARSGE